MERHETKYDNGAVRVDCWTCGIHDALQRDPSHPLASWDRVAAPMPKKTRNQPGIASKVLKHWASSAGYRARFGSRGKFDAERIRRGRPKSLPRLGLRVYFSCLGDVETSGVSSKSWLPETGRRLDQTCATGVYPTVNGTSKNAGRDGMQSLVSCVGCTNR